MHFPCKFHEKYKPTVILETMQGRFVQFRGNGAFCTCRPQRKRNTSNRAQMQDNKIDLNSGSTWIREHLKQLSAYTPIEPFEIISAKLGRRPEDIVKLDANENPYGPPPEVLDALGSMKFPNIYPDPESRTLRKALSNWTGVPAENLLVCMD